MNALFDTSFVSALHNANDPHHHEAREQLLAVRESQPLIPSIVIAECLMRDVDTMHLITVCKKLSGSFLQATEKELHTIANMPYPLRKHLKANDCLVLAHAILNNAELFTFDLRLRKAYEDMKKT